MIHLRNSLAILLAGGLLVLGAGEARADKIVKWVDAQGVTHYGEKAPEGASATPIKVRDTTSSDAEDEIERLNKAREARSAAREDDEDSTGEKKPARPKPAGSDKGNGDAEANDPNQKACDQHRKNLEILKSGKRARILDEKGKSRAMSEAERQAQMELAESEVKRCEQLEKVKAARDGKPAGKAAE